MPILVARKRALQMSKTPQKTTTFSKFQLYEYLNNTKLHGNFKLKIFSLNILYAQILDILPKVHCSKFNETELIYFQNWGNYLKVE